ncbi:MAG: methionine synthase [Candidatus Omnitrophota bacterium]
MYSLKGLATGIGSLPHKDAKEAVRFVFKYVPDAPFWPQLPKRDIREGMIAQFSENIPCLKVNRDGLYFDAKDKEGQLESFYARVIDNDTEYFKISRDFALGLHEFYDSLKKTGGKTLDFVKCQVTGPFTFSCGIKDDKGIALLHDGVFKQAILKGLAMKALWQIKYFKEFTKKVILFFDEPYLGCFGSAYTPLNREEVVRDLTEFTAQIKSEDCLIGVHCCGNTDWSIFTDIEGIDIINFDAFGFMEKFLLYAGEIAKFLKRGGIICWGIVPTSDFTGDESAAALVDKLKSAISTLEKKGTDSRLLSESLMISPACGLGTLEAEKAEKIFQLLNEASSFLRKNP